MKKYILDKKTVLITGITSGIGKSIALRYAVEDWNILGHYFSSVEKVEEIKREIDGCDVACEFFKADFTCQVEIESLVIKLKDYRIDAIVNNAGTYIVSKHFTELSFKEIIDTFTLNTVSAMLITSGLFSGMKERNFGRIVNISSIASKYGGSSSSMPYGCSKLALEGITKTLAKEGAEFNILVNTIRPGVIDTDFYKKFPKDMSKRIEMIPVKRMGKAEEVAEMVFYLGSEKNTFITNQVITVSGGE